MQSRSSSDLECRRFLVSGRVQRVGFRAATRRRAMQLQLAGFAHNLEDGRVEVQVLGSSQAVSRFRAWLDDGPVMARVDAVEEVDARDGPDDDFQVG